MESLRKLNFGHNLKGWKTILDFLPAEWPKMAWSLLYKTSANIEGYKRVIGSGSETAVSEGFGGGVLSLWKAGSGSFGGTGLLQANAVKGQTVAGLLVGVLTGLGGASQEDQQPAISGGNEVNKEARWMYTVPFYFFPSDNLVAVK
jgi:hypothetical protein